MRAYSVLVSFVFAFVLNGCTAQKSDTAYYDRANKVSKEALIELERE